MPRFAVSSFMSSLTNRDKDKTPSPTSSPATVVQTYPEKQESDTFRPTTPQRAPTQPSNIRNSPQRWEEQQRGHQRNTSRPMSMVQTYQPPLMEMDRDTLPELQPIFTFLNSHGNKLYQEGYFLKLDDQNARTSAKQFVHGLECGLTFYRGKAKCGQNMDGVLCTACGHRSLTLGRGGTRRCWF